MLLTEPTGDVVRPTEPEKGRNILTEPERGKLPAEVRVENSETDDEGAEAGVMLREPEAPTRDPVDEWRAVPVFTIDSDEECGVFAFRWPALEWSGEAGAEIKEEPDTLGERLGDLSGVDSGVSARKKNSL